MNRETVAFVIATLYTLDERRRGMGNSPGFEELLKMGRRPNLHEAWQVLKEEGFLGEFACEFTYDPLYGKTNLDEVFSHASRDGLIRLGGTDFCYHLDVLDPKEVEHLLEGAGVSESFVEAAARRLRELLG